MPELPEVEVICRGLAANLLGRTIVEVIFGSQQMRLPLPVKESKQWVIGHKVVALRRRAKFILVELDSGAIMLLHLGMTGRLNFFPAGSAVAKHDHVRWLLDNDLELRFNDTRRFGSIQVIPPGTSATETMGELGPDPFWPEFSAEYLARLAQGRRVPVKCFLMDNRVVTGIGNIYASETLFVSGVNPTTPASQLTLEVWHQIVTNSKTILSEAIACGGTTISDYVNSRGEKGYFQIKLRAYGREGRPCLSCGQAIAQIRLGGRASFYCPVCQPLPPVAAKATKKRG